VGLAGHDELRHSDVRFIIKRPSDIRHTLTVLPALPKLSPCCGVNHIRAVETALFDHLISKLLQHGGKVEAISFYFRHNLDSPWDHLPISYEFPCQLLRRVKRESRPGASPLAIIPALLISTSIRR
jgi:hypothetical protein